MNIQSLPFGEPALFAQVADLLGGSLVLGQKTDNQLDVHDLVLAGIPIKALDHFLEGLVVLRRDRFLDGALGVSLRTLQRHKASADCLLNREQSGRTWKVAEVLAMAIEIFGSRADAEAWLQSPAIGLDQRRPIDLLGTIAGTEAVQTFLGRLDHGVYA